MTREHPLRALLFGSRLYRLSLRTRTVFAAWTPPDPWPGDADRISGITADNDPATPAFRRWHGFLWLADLKALGTDAARDKARELIAAWAEDNGGWRAETWRTDILGDRLTHWLTHRAWLSETMFSGLLGAQARHLNRWAARPDAGAGPLSGIRGWLAATLALSDLRRRLPTVLATLEQQIERQIEPDGGHWERCPERHLAALAKLVHMRAMLVAAQVEVPQTLRDAIDRMAPMLRAYRHGDGGFAVFNGGGEGDKAEIDRVLTLTGSRGRAAASAPHTGFHRLAAKRAIVIVDTGAPVDAFPLTAGHAGTLGFEFSLGKRRLVVNCGGGAAGPLLEALRGTSAHSTLIVDDTHSSDLVEGGGFGPRRVRHVEVRRRETDGNLLIEAGHDGYRETFGLTHRRALYLSATGDDLRGEDVLEGEGNEARPFHLRFHLHPDVRAGLVEAGAEVLLALPGGHGWRFHVGGGKASIEDSLYLGGGQRRRCSQIVVSAAYKSPQTSIKWRFSKA